ncbi:MAG: signal peptidase I [Bacillota bacterium]|nr:signal peptidase I [Bacillota bacterium]
MAKKIKKILSGILLVFLVFIVIMVVTERVQGKLPNFFGYQVFRISSGSMEPDLHMYDIIVCKKVPITDLQVGDVISYNGTEGDLAGKIITHKVIEKPYKTASGYFLQTKGIVSGAQPDPVISGGQVLGRYIYKIPLINYLFNFFITPLGLIVCLLIIGLLFFNELFILIRKIKSANEEENIDDSKISKDAKILVNKDLKKKKRKNPFAKPKHLKKKSKSKHKKSKKSKHIK